MSAAYKILTRDQWAELAGRGVFEGAPIDRADGYIHLSTEAQWRETAQKHFAGQGDLVLTEVDLDALKDVRWEASRGGALFPHLYGAPLTLTAVRSAEGFDVGEDGEISALRPEPAWA
jgi:uncharacterized protein (DUF952 family)